MTDELKPDPDIAAALRRLEGDPPFESLDWEHLHAAIMRRAAGEIHSVARRGMSWLDYTARWARAAIPVTAVIIVVIVLWMQRMVPAEPAALDAGEVSLAARDAISMIASGDVTDHEVVDAVTGPTSRDWLLYDVLENR